MSAPNSATPPASRQRTSARGLASLIAGRGRRARSPRGRGGARRRRSPQPRTRRATASRLPRRRARGSACRRASAPACAIRRREQRRGRPAPPSSARRGSWRATSGSSVAIAARLDVGRVRDDRVVARRAGRRAGRRGTSATLEPEPLAVGARDGERARRRRRSPLSSQIGPLVRERERDRADAAAAVEHAAPLRQLERELDEQLGLRARDEHARVDRELERGGTPGGRRCRRPARDRRRGGARATGSVRTAAPATGACGSAWSALARRRRARRRAAARRRARRSASRRPRSRCARRRARRAR